jgi:predicted nucleic acid-binding protein
MVLFKAKLKLKSVKLSSKDKQYIQMAKKVADEFDLNDHPFIVLALKLDDSI